MLIICSPYWYYLVIFLAALSYAQTINPFLQQQFSDGSNWFNYGYHGRMHDCGMLPPKTDFESTGKYLYDASRFMPEATGLFENVNENIHDQRNFQSNFAWNPAVFSQQSFLQPFLPLVSKYFGNGYLYQQRDTKPPLQWQNRNSDFSFRSNFQVCDKEGMPSSIDLGSADRTVHDSSASADETPELFERLDENILNQHNLQFNTPLNPAEQAQQPLLQPSLWQVPECTVNEYFSQHTDHGNFGGEPVFAQRFLQPADASRVVAADGGLVSNTLEHFYPNLNYGNNEEYGDIAGRGHNTACDSNVADGTSFVGHRGLISEPCSNSGGFYPEASSHYAIQPGQSSLPIKKRRSTAISPTIQTDLPHKHAYIHTGIRPYNSDRCSAEFYRADHLKAYRGCEQRQGEQSVAGIMELCDQQEVVQTDDVVEVTTVPTERQQYSCHWSGHTLKFTRIRDPDRHIKSHASNSTHLCIQCNETFVMKTNLNRHLRKMHPRQFQR